MSKDRSTAQLDIVTALDNLAVSGMKDKARLKAALHHIRSIKNGPGLSRRDMEKNIHELVSAVEPLADITSCDTKPPRLMIDTLLMSWEAELYFYGTK